MSVQDAHDQAGALLVEVEAILELASIQGGSKLIPS